jgi:hypothetical protein
MVIARDSNVSGKPRALAWVGVIGFFALASAIQIVAYSAPSMLHFGSYAAPQAVRQLIVLSWFFAPAVLASIASIRVLRAASIGVGGAVKAWAVTSVVLLALLSIYVGAFVSFYTWGT